MRVTKAAELILNNPFCILGLPCNAEKMDILKVQEKINKLSKIGAEKSYKTDFYSDSLPEIDRSSGIIQSAMARIDKPESKLFWFINKHYIQQFSSEEIKNEFLNNDTIEHINYDCFLANYLFLLLNDNSFSDNVRWEKVLIYIDFLLSDDAQKLMFLFLNRFGTETDSLQSIISNNILTPIYDLVANSNAKVNMSLLNLIARYKTKQFNDLKDNLLEQLINNIERECSFVSDFTSTIHNIETASKEQISETVKTANKLIEVGKSLVSPILDNTLISSMHADRIKDTYYTELSKLSNIFAFGKKFKNAYSCATHANKYAPVYKMSESKENLELLKELKNAEEKVQHLKNTNQLSNHDITLLSSNDPTVFMLAFRAISGNAKSQLILGSIYKTPTYKRNKQLNIPYNLTEGIKWLEKSALQDDAQAQLELGACYFTGDGVATNISTADFWIRKAANQGDVEAIKTLSMLESDYRYKSLVSKISYTNSSSNSSNPYSSQGSDSDNTGCVWLAIIGFIIFVIIAIANSGY